jgi:GNAT superfamily N-acetyltransferase
MSPKPANKKAATPGELTTRVLSRRDWPVVQELFGDKGACGGCWCMWWRLPRGGKLWHESKGEKNRNDFRRLVESGKVHGILAFAGAEPVGWCCFGPRSTFPRTERVRALAREWSPDTWSIVCFYMAPRWRGKGVATRLLEAATARALELGAREIEGYPVVPKTGAIPNVFAYTGLPSLFEKQGYCELDRPGMSRPIYVRARAANTDKKFK